MKKYLTNFVCPECGKELFTSDLEGYMFVCNHCGGHFTDTEVKWHDWETSNLYAHCSMDQYRKYSEKLTMAARFTKCAVMSYNDKKNCVQCEWIHPSYAQIWLMQEELEKIGFPDWETGVTEKKNRSASEWAVSMAAYLFLREIFGKEHYPETVRNEMEWILDELESKDPSEILVQCLKKEFTEGNYSCADGKEVDKLAEAFSLEKDDAAHIVDILRRVLTR